MSNVQNVADISVVIPTYNRCVLLKRAISSALNQTIRSKKIIVVDNGSTDKTYEMISSLFPQITYIYENRRGVSIARNKGIKNCHSSWIAFLDSDDVWEPQKLEKQLFFTNNINKKFRLIHTNEIWYKNDKFQNQSRKHQKSGGDIFQKSLEFCCISPSSAFIKKEVFDDYGFFDESLEVCEDYDMWIRITAKEEVGFLDKPFVKKYGGHDDQLSKKYWGMDRFRIKSLEKNLINNWFTLEQKKSVLKILLKKLTIVSNGAKKRDNEKIYKKYSEKFNYWSLELDKYNNEKFNNKKNFC
tara:strand:- start:113 stop:1009 length:897 start_codon:yes stop_codon:yes gene_type:complete